MVKTPRTRHSKSRTPLTIELGAEDVKPLDEAAAGQPEIRDEATESIEVPAQPDPELLIVENEPAEAEAATASGADDRLPADDPKDAAPSFGRRDDDARRPEPAAVKARGNSSNIAAGLIGAVLALGGFYGLQAAGIMGVPGGGAASPSLEPLESQIAGLRSELDGLKSAPATDSGLDQLKSAVASLQTAVQSGGAGDGVAVAALDERLKKIEAAPGVPQELNQQIAGIENKVTAAADSTARSGERIAALEQSVSTLAGQVEQQASQPKVALAIAATALKSAVERGGPFAAEAETFAAIAPDAPQLAALRAHAQEGVATEADLAASFPQAADAMIAAAKPVDPNAGILERLLDSAESVVKVRPVGSVAGDAPDARIARMEVALKAGDLEKALAEYDGLPDAAKQAGAALAARIKARIEVTKLVDQLVAGAMKAA